MYLGPNMLPICSLVARKESLATLVLFGCMKPPSLILHKWQLVSMVGVDWCFHLLRGTMFELPSWASPFACCGMGSLNLTSAWELVLT